MASKFKSFSNVCEECSFTEVLVVSVVLVLLGLIGGLVPLGLILYYLLSPSHPDERSAENTCERGQMLDA